MKQMAKTLRVAIMSVGLLLFAGFFFAEDDFITTAPVEQKDSTETIKAENVEAVQVEKEAVKPAPEAKKAVVEKISTAELKDKVKVIVMVSQVVKQKSLDLLPDGTNKNHRILVKLQDCKVGAETIKVGTGGVVRIRTAPHDKEAWVVIDLENGQKWNVTADGRRIIIDVLKSAGAQAEKKEAVAAEDYKPSGMLYRIMDVAGKDLAKKTRVIVTSDGPVKYRVMKDSKNKTVTLNVVDAVSVWKETSVQIGKGAVDAVTLRENKSGKTVDIAVKLTENAPYTVTRDQNQIIIDIDHPAVDSSKKKRQLDLYQKISINVQNAPMTAVLRMLTVQTGYEFIAGPSVNDARPVTIIEEDQPFVSVLRDILGAQGLSFEVRANMIKVGSVSDIKAGKIMMQQMTRFYYPRTMKPLELKDIVDMQLSKEVMMDVKVESDKTEGQERLIIAGTEGDIERVMDMIANVDAGGSSDAGEEYSGGIKTRTFKVQYVDASVLKDSLSSFLSSTGKIVADDRSGSIIVTDSVKYIKKIENVISRIDVKVRQVSVEARLYEINVNQAKNIGVQWGGQSQNKEPFIKGDVSPLAFSPTGSLTLGFLQSGFDINATLNALQTKSDATLLSSPKVTVQNNKTALIYTTRTTYYATTDVTSGPGGTVATTKYNSIDLPIQLKVTPKITDDGQINMQVDVTVKKILGTTAVNGPPDTSEQNASTLVTARNNDTIVIGGMISDRVSNVENKVPFFGDLPLIGGLFKGTTESKDRVELVVFLTPSIIDEEN